MATFKINRPIATIEHNEANTRHTYKVTADSWSLEYTRVNWQETVKAAEKLAANFLATFDADAKEIEASGKREDIMEPLVAHGLFTKRKKLKSRYAKAKI